MATHTPWGASQTADQIAPGITRYTTASHGGIKLSNKRRASMPAILRDIEPFAGPGWYEEDCDWAIVVLAFPEYFDGFAIWEAVKMSRSLCIRWRDDAVGHFTLPPQGRATLAKSEEWERDHAGHWYQRSAGTSRGGGWWAEYRTIDGARETQITFDRPSQSLYGLVSPEDMEALIVDRADLATA